MALADPNLFSALQVQIQIVGGLQVPSEIVAALHYQIVYRIQDRAFNLSKYGIGDSLFISVNINDQPRCISTVEAKVDDKTKMVKDLINLFQKRLNDVAKEPAAPGQDFFSCLAQREKEIENLKEQIKIL
ncbi:hypothetical protein PVK06_041893 [Gossypium arboreum]|uniref:Uncharacterized protein n=1 Tax=Gossypium arboreum TaxID=29729 RepID=A0ABR0NA38_GOSAR|nr:hypothetical protein PVK06_041893 [Gossypium arboreum]